MCVNFSVNRVGIHCGCKTGSDFILLDSDTRIFCQDPVLRSRSVFDRLRFFRLRLQLLEKLGFHFTESVRISSVLPKVEPGAIRYLHTGSDQSVPALAPEHVRI